MGILEAPPMNFSRALEHIKLGKKVARTGWNGKDMWIALLQHDPSSAMFRSYIYIHPVDGQLMPWVASQTDLLADDWILVH